jgi:hypothetical protein
VTEPAEVSLDPLARLREPFSPNQISKLPKPFKKDAPKGRCDECGGYHGLPAVHLDYVGHAALTHRLLDVDPRWTWEPLSWGQDGLPMLDASGGMWIKLTVAGVTRLGYGSADGKRGGDAVKELIGDALRNAAMRFGAALDLWHKGDLHASSNAEEPEPQQRGANDAQQDRDTGGGQRRQQSPDRAMIDWVDKAKAKLASFDGAPSFNAFSDYTNDDEFVRRKNVIAEANPSLGAELRQAIEAAAGRCDDVPF